MNKKDVFNKNIRDNLKIGDEIQLKRGQGWSKELLRLIDIKPGEYIKAENLPGGSPIKVQMPISRYGVSWRLYNRHASYKTGEPWEAIKNLNNWSDFDDARQVLNHRYHNSFKNPPSKEWHHIHERSAGGVNSVDNLAITDAINNQNFNQWFAKPQQGTGGVPLRQFLKGASARELGHGGLKQSQHMG